MNNGNTFELSSHVWDNAESQKVTTAALFKWLHDQKIDPQLGVIVLARALGMTIGGMSSSRGHAKDGCKLFANVVEMQALNMIDREVI